ncbi:MAG: type II toxin-antitoxin system HicA family toxin [Lachnospiraceae bacterium]|nr:type II toxin-antitoxin system HicA family toxin [Lachnospiraceae bacterium]
MQKKEELIRKLTRKPSPTNFTIRELDSLMKKCGCKKFESSRGSGIGYLHEKSKRIVQFDGPHPGNELYRYQIKMIISFLREVGELL